MFKIIPIDQVHPAADNLRRRLGDTRDLAASIASVGIVEPLLVIVRPDEDGGGYTIVAGQRRLAAAQAAGLMDVPCTIRSLTEMERVEIMVAENLARAGLSVMEEATGYFRMAEFGLTAKDLAKRLGRSVPHIKARLAFLELPRSAQNKLDNGTLTIGDAAALLTLKDHPDVIRQLITDDGDPWDRRDLERAVVREVGRIDAEAKACAARSDLDERGVRVIDEWDRYSNRPSQPVAIGSNHGELDVRPTRHEREACHAAHVTRSGEVVLLCTEPTRHRSGGESKTKAPEDARPTRTESKSAERAEARQRRARDGERRSFTTDLLTRRLPRADAQALVATQYVAGAGANQARAACALLDIEAVSTGYHDSHRAALVAYATVSTAQRDRACLALALAVGDDATGYDPEGRGEIAATHLAFLTAFGWTPAVVGDEDTAA